MKVEVVLTPAEIAGLPHRDLNGTACVVFDVLRATSTILTALYNGASRVYPVTTVAEARDLRETRLPDALLGGERGGVKIEGFDLGNSPREYTSEIVTGRDIVVTTTNGTVALKACVAAPLVLAGAIVNLRALADYFSACRASVERILLVCAGTGERFALEDGLAAGALIARLNPSAMDDASAAMLAVYKRQRHNFLKALQTSENGRRLAEIGLDGDIEWCARESPLPLVAVMREGALVGEKISPASAECTPN